MQKKNRIVVKTITKEGLVINQYISVKRFKKLLWDLHLLEGRKEIKKIDIKNGLV